MTRTAEPVGARRTDGPSKAEAAIVLAAGSGTRFGAPKQFATAAGRRLVDLAIQTVAPVSRRVILVLPDNTAWTGPPVDTVVPGGADRRASVRGALASLPASGTVIVHQASNPLASPELVDSLLAAIDRGAPAAFPGLRPSDIVRTVQGRSAGPVVGRDDLVLVQCPAAFRIDVLRAAHAVDDPIALEDTALVSAAGYAVEVVPGDPRNVHVATPADLEIVEALLLVASR